MGKIIEVNQIYDSLKKALKEEVKAFSRLRLASLCIGKDCACDTYLSAQKKLAQELGVECSAVELGAKASMEEVRKKIQELNKDETINGIIVNKPFPKRFKEDEIFSAIKEKKDVEGMNPSNLGGLFYEGPLFLSPTVLSVLEILKTLKLDIYGKEIVIVGFSTLIGKPLSLLLGREFATVTITHIGTYEAGKLPLHVEGADILISAVGKPHLIKGSWIKKGAVVIDVGIGQMEGKVVGDVELDKAKDKASFITPVPGGVGRLTTLFLFKNLLKAVRL